MSLIYYKLISTRLVGTCFEDLPNEVMYEIFDYLDTVHAFEAFYQLNHRFRCLFTDSSLPLKINFSLISKSKLEYYSKYILPSYIHRIISLRFPHQMSVNLFHRFFSFKSFHRLQSIMFHKITTKKLLLFLHDLTSLPQLFSLTITTIDQSDQDKTICQLICHLPVLKYCKISFDDTRKDLPFPVTDHQTLANSSIEYLIIDGFYNIDGLIPIFSHMSKLRHFSCNSLWGSDNLTHSTEGISSSLEYLSLKLDDVSFEKFQSIISRFNFPLKVLHLTALFDKKYLDAYRWEKLIINHMPNLRVFDYECHCNTIDSHDLIDKFHSAFWQERNWFFGHRHRQLYNKTYAYVYSIKPYR